MQLIANNNPVQNIIQDTSEIITQSSSGFIEANTQEVTLEHLKKECIIPVFSKDNETTISHAQFIEKTTEVVQGFFPEMLVNQPQIRVSHVVKGRVPSAIGKPAKDLLEEEKTIYYERCAFLIELPEVFEVVNGNKITLNIGGVRAYNQENLYSKKSLEKFKIFIGFKNTVCTNLCISTDGFLNEVRISSIHELTNQMEGLFSNYNKEKHLTLMLKMPQYSFTEKQFAHFIGKIKMYQHLSKAEKQLIFPIALTESQIGNIIKNYYQCPNFGRSLDGSINFWKLYNLITEANKSSYIDSNFERNVCAYELVNELGYSMKNREPNWLTSN
ncbi:DUF3871 family protein [uncultured Maribacter sp.]|uniref:DUF3871 family protein n=1 Tax=uncultured Maribacter sp. TaxID=431308 RepID=UPI00260B591A|nr:DUF3871 family protein [uncultured Maribacter sp.]